MFGVIIFTFLYFMTKVFYVFFIMWRGYNLNVNASFGKVLTECLNQIAEVLHISPDIFLILYPFTWILDKLSSIHIDLSTVQVSCTGSQAPFELVINCIILGVVVILIESNYQVLFSVSLDKTITSVLELLYNDYFKKRLILKNKWGCLKDITFFLGLCVMKYIASFHFLLKLIQFAMVFVTINAFFPFHLSDKNCNQIPGFVGIDKGLSVASTMLMYIIAPAVIYTLSVVLVPGIPTFNESHPRLYKLINTVNNTLRKHNDHHTFELSDSFLIKFIPQIVQTVIKYLSICMNFLSPDILAFFAVNGFLLYIKGSLDKLTGDDQNSNKENEVSIEHICYDSLSQSTKASTDSTKGSTKGSYSKEYNAKVPSFYTLSLWIHKELSQKYNSNNNVYLDKVLLTVSFTVFGHMFTEIGRCGWIIVAIKMVSL